MNAEAVYDAMEDADTGLREALIRCCALSEDAVAKISHAARVLAVSFGEAALSTGFVRQEDLDYARQSTRQIAELPSRRVRPGPDLVLPRDPFDARTEKVLALRTELLLRHEAGARANMVALLSPCAGEGRSQLAAELALAFAQLGHPTLLVDADLRNPQQHRLFNADNDSGLSQAISRREAPVLQAVENTAHMSLLTAGPIPLNPLELLSDHHFERLVREWRHSYEFVVIDTAPVGQYSDGLAVATLVGRVLALSRANHTPYEQQREMLRRLSVTRSQILGAVINHF